MQTDSKILLCQYLYDALNRLVASAPAQADTQRFYLKDRLTTEIQGAEQRSIMQHEDQMLAQQQRQSGTVETHLLATDQQRSVLNVLAGALSKPLAYTPYGHRHPENGLLSLLGFNGERPDPVTGCYLLGNGYRAFNPVLMRFNSPDSWSPFEEGGLNAYAYCLDPINFADPSGHVVSINMLSSTFRSIYKPLTLTGRNIPKINHTPRTGPMRDLQKIGTGINSYKDAHKSKWRLNIGAHGLQTSSGSSLVASGKTLVNPKQLHSMILAQGIDLQSIESIRLLICHSGEGGANSFAAELTRLTNKPVKGFIGRLRTNNSAEVIDKIFDDALINYPNQPIADRYDLPHKKVFKKNPYKLFSNPSKYLSHNYKSIRFAP